jgi:ADP-ribose pyrophosphatase
VSEDGLEILERETVYRGFFRVDKFRIRHRLYAGGWSEPMVREMFERGRAVALLLYDPEADAVVLVEQLRLAAHLAGLPAWQTEAVAGIVGPSDPTEESVARREATEEAGVTVEGALLPIHRFMPSTGACTEIIDLYCGRVDVKSAAGTHGLADEHEDTKVVVLPYREAMRRLRSGAIVSSPTMLALYWLAANRARLRRAWPAAP